MSILIQIISLIALLSVFIRIVNRLSYPTLHMKFNITVKEKTIII